MLSGFEADDDQRGWLAGAALWAIGSAMAYWLASSMVNPALWHSGAIALAVLVSIISLGLRLPDLLSRGSVSAGLTHALWLLCFLAQISWAGFLAAHSATGTIAAEVVVICLGLEVWILILFIKRERLPWLVQMFFGDHVALRSADVKDTIEVKDTIGELEDQGIGNKGEIQREFVDGIDENGARYLSGTVQVQMQAQQRNDAFVIGFCPALDGVADIELECDSEDVTLKVEHVTETGARVSIRRRTIGEEATVMIDWFAKASTDVPMRTALNLP